MTLREILDQVFLSNSIESYCWAAGIMLVGLILKRLVTGIVAQSIFRFLQKFSTGVGYQQLLELLKKPIGYFIFLCTLYLALQQLTPPVEWHLKPTDQFGLLMVIKDLLKLGFIFSVTWVLLRIIDFLGLVMLHKASLTESKTDDQLIPFIKEALKILIGIFSVFFILSAVFNVNITSLVAGLGIGGLAIALAAQESLANLLGSFTIFLDRPFQIGDFIKVGSVSGTVENIGFRSTRIRTEDMSYVTVPNKKMVEAELDNLTLRTSRRVRFFIGLVYSTSPDTLQKIVNDIQKYLDDHRMTNNDSRVRFYSYGTSSLDLLVQYYIIATDNDNYINVRQEINLKIMQIVHQHGSDFAFPTNTVYLRKSE